GRMQHRLVVGSLALVSLALAYTPAMTAAQAPAAKSAPAAQPKVPAAPKPAGALAMPRMAITTVRIKPELVDEWMEFQKSETIPALRKAGVSERTVIATAIGESFEMTFLTPVKNFAERDGDNPIVKALGADGARAYAAKNRRFITEQHTYVNTVRTDLSYQPAPGATAPAGIAVVSTYSIAGGHNADFEAYIKTDLTPAHKQLKTGGFIVHQALFGGDGGTFVVATLLPNFAALDKGPAIVRAYGQARADAIQQRLAGFVTHIERTVVRVVPELSFQAARPMSDHE
ncbi:MAG TPA: hypothetical protein VGJ29_10040, partial [Vicinamibacterales bacterium]